MKKIDALLKKVELFERLAVYGDRKSFLQALSQSADIEQFPPMSGAGVNAPYVPGTAPSVNQPKTLPVEPTADIQSFPVGSNLGVNAPFPGEFQQNTLNTNPAFTPTPIPPSTNKPARQQLVYNPKVEKVQNFLNKTLALGGTGEAVMAPITPDGKLGPETMKALKLWQQKNKLPDLNSAFISALSRNDSETTV